MNTHRHFYGTKYNYLHKVHKKLYGDGVPALNSSAVLVTWDCHTNSYTHTTNTHPKYNMAFVHNKINYFLVFKVFFNGKKSHAFYKHCQDGK